MRTLWINALLVTTLLRPATPPTVPGQQGQTTRVVVPKTARATASNRALVLRYFRDVLDAGQIDLVDELFHADSIVHRAEGDLTGLAALKTFLGRRALYSSFATEIHDVFESGDRVVVRHTHRAVGTGPFKSRMGTYDITGKTITWDAIAIFRMKGGKVAEEWVNRDELGMLLTSGIVGGTPTKYPTMLDMTFPEFEAAVRKTDIVLLPIGAIEEHNAHLPLGTDAMNATAQVFEIQQYLSTARVETIVGPPLNIGITNEVRDWARTGTYPYPGSLTIAKSTFVALYVDVLRSLRDNGLRRAFLYVGHLGARHVEAVVQTVEEANRSVEGLTVYATIDSDVVERLKLPPSPHILSVQKLRNFDMLAQLLGGGTELPRTTHADGAETSWTLFFHPEVVRPGYQGFPQTPSSIFLEVLNSGDRSKNPTGSGGFPFDKASAAVGKQIVDYRTARIGDAILQVLRAK